MRIAPSTSRAMAPVAEGTTIRPDPHPADSQPEPAGSEAAPPPRKPSVLVRISRAVDQSIQRFFTWEGGFVARHPWKVVIASVVVFLLCMIGFRKFQMELDGAYLFTPSGAAAFADEEYVRAVWSSGTANQDTRVQLFGTTPDGSSSKVNLLEKERLLELQRAYDAIVVQTVTWNGTVYPYGAVCARYAGPTTPCKANSILQFWGFNRTRLELDTDVLATINTPMVDYTGRPVGLGSLLGGTTRDFRGRVISAEATQTTLFLVYNESRAASKRLEDPVEADWQAVILKVAYEEWKSTSVKIFVYNSAAVDKEASAAISKDVMLLSIGYVLVIVYTHISLSRNSRVYQKVHLTILAFLGIAMGVVGTLGACSGFGVKFNFAVQILPFLLVGLGVDDVFIIIGCYFQQDLSLPAEERIKRTMASAGASITVTSLTDFVAFCLGMWTSLPSLKAFAAFAAVGIVLVYLYMVTFFVAFLAMDARREERLKKNFNAGCWGVSCCCVDTRDEEVAMPPPSADTSYTGQAPEKEAPSHASTAMSLGAGGSAGDMHVVIPTVQKMNGQPGKGGDSPSGLEQDFTTDKCIGSGRFDPKAPTLQTRLVSIWLPAVTLTWWGKILVLLLEAGMLAAAGVGISRLVTDFKYREWFVPANSWLHGAYEVENTYFGGEQVPFSIYTKTSIDGRGYFYYQDQLAAIAPQLRQNTEYVAAQPPIYSWYDDFSAWLGTSSFAPLLGPGGRAQNEQNFTTMLGSWLQGPGSYASPNFVFAPDGTILSTKINAFSQRLVDGSWSTRFVDSVRALATNAASQLQAIAFGWPFANFDGFKVIATETIRNVITSGVVVFVIILILLASIPGSLFVGTMVVLCDVGLLGFMPYVGLTFNSVTAITLVLAVGISVDYSAHICRAFLVAKGTRQERAFAALKDIGGEVLDGAFTTWLVIVVMAGAKHYIFRVIFAMFFALIVLALWHGIVLLPVLLSLFGPASISL